MSELQKQILQIMEEGSNRGKAMLTMKDLSKKMGVSQLKLKKEVRVLVENAEVCYWSSGSSNYMMLRDDYNRMKENQIEN